MKSSYKNGQVSLDGLYTAILAVLLIGIAIGIGIFVLNETAEATSTQAYTNVNESHTEAQIEAANGVLLSGSSLCGSHNFAITTVINSSGGEIIASGNYTVNTNSGAFSNLTATDTGPGWNITYTYTATSDNSTSSSCRTLKTVGTGIGGFADWIAVIVVTLAAAVVLGVVINSFGRRRAI